ncbi:unnamed protein product [Heligmosomoides polygyrus]|uniref:Uncharacterized protein n=1 Tax=Heligmosomoides polygyrus TaxID=6339 RepID=A0A183FZ17_HELPZ|nr:unnamed protein product [Heligmosomoides polygyrus]
MKRLGYSGAKMQASLGDAIFSESVDHCGKTGELTACKRVGEPNIEGIDDDVLTTPRLPQLSWPQLPF